VNRLHDADPIPYQRPPKLYFHYLGSFEFATTHVAIQAFHSQSTLPTWHFRAWPHATYCVEN
jgi:hypothetical protein